MVGWESRCNTNELIVATPPPCAAQKKSLNLGKFSAGLDDYQYEDAGDADDDFM